MALLIERKALGRADGIIASDLSDKMAAIQAEQNYADDDGSFDLNTIRRWIDEYSALAARGAETLDVATEDKAIETPVGAVATRLYNPERQAPTLVFVHGGGWVMGGMKSHDHIARWLASQTESRVVQIEYRLAPEHPYPAAVNDIAAVLSATLSHSRGSPVLVAGDSAGANLAASALLCLSKDERREIAGFVSIYGAYAPEMNLSSHRLYGDGRFGLSESQMRWFWNLYAPQLPPEARAKKLSPLSADLSDFPSTLCIGAECDLLLDDTLAFYGELTKACVDVSLSLWPSLPHGCMHFVGAVGSVTEAAGSIVQFVNARGRRSGMRSRAPGAALGSKPDQKAAQNPEVEAAPGALCWSMSSRCLRPVVPDSMVRSPIGSPGTSSGAISRRGRYCREKRAPARRLACRGAPIARRSAPSPRKAS